MIIRCILFSSLLSKYECRGENNYEKIRLSHWQEAARFQASSLPLAVLTTISRTTPALRTWMQGSERIVDLIFDESNDVQDHLACGSLSFAKRLRYALKKAAESIQVLYVNRREDAVCWIVSLRASEARTTLFREKRRRLTSSTDSQNGFYHIEKLPLFYKMCDIVDIQPISFQPKLKAMNGRSFIVHTRQFLSVSSKFPIEEIVNNSLRKVFGCQSKSSAQVCASWWSVFSQDSAECLTPQIKESTTGKTRLEWDNHPSNSCVLSFIIHLVTQSNVHKIENIPQLRTTQEHLSIIGDESVVGIEAFSTSILLTSNSTGAQIIKSTNEFAAISLQGGSTSGDTPLWDLGLKGQGLYLQVADTDVDDASCWLSDDIETNATLNGVFESELQVARSTYDAPVTEHSRRKVVQYIAYPNTGSAYDYDAKVGGHGTHTAGSIAGSLSASESHYTNCSEVLLEYGYSNLDGVYEKVEPYTYTSDADVDFYYYSADTGLYFYRYSNYWVLGTTLESGSGLYSYSECSLITVPEIFRDCPEATPNPMLASQCIDTSAQGLAPEAKLMAFDFGDDTGALYSPSSLYLQMFTPAYDAGARIFSNSWGGGYEYYGSAQDVDQFMYDFNDALILFAAGNDGDDIGISSILSPGVAKNCLTVGAAENSIPVDTVAYFSSRGPTSDQRIKPDCLSPGDPIASASSSGYEGLATCSATYKSGTSMATPTLAGLASLLRQFLVENHHIEYSQVGYNHSIYNTTAPSGALLKAMLIASTQPVYYGYDMSSTKIELSTIYSGTPDYHQGFGIINATRVLPLSLNLELFLYDHELSEYENFDVAFVTGMATDVSIVLAWTDPAASTFCSTCLVHDLDLQVWIDGIRKYSNFGEDSEDVVNNVEKVATNLVAGISVQIRVRANALAYADAQSFALVIVGSLEPVVAQIPTHAPTLRDTSCDVIDIVFGYSNTDGLFYRVDYTYADPTVEVDYFLECNDLAETYIYRYLGLYWVLGAGPFDSGSALLFTQCDILTFPDALTSCTWNTGTPTYTCYSATAAPSPSPSTLVPTQATTSSTLACDRNDDCPSGQKCSSLISSVASKDRKKKQRRYPLFVRYKEEETMTSGICIDV
uniref:subtilisin n=1 Tax=Aureoumbra lagunensis TaxID=44058 RepID=A0A7S3JQM5_9STRA